MAHRIRTLAVLLCMLAAPACTMYEGTHFSVSFGTGVYVTIHQRPSAAVFYGHTVLCRSDAGCTLEGMRSLLRFDWWGDNPLSDIDFFFDRSQIGDFAEAARAIGGVNERRCFVLHRNANPFGDRHNWTWRTSGGECRP